MTKETMKETATELVNEYYHGPAKYRFRFYLKIKTMLAEGYSEDEIVDELEWGDFYEDWYEYCSSYGD